MRPVSPASLLPQAAIATIDAAVRSQGHETIYHGAHPGPAGSRIAAEKIASAFLKLHIPPR